MDPLTVRAEFSFKGENNDELCFRKGDVITVTQREDGGWWEGTLSDKTGWFPSNYVIEYKATLPLSETIRPPQEVQASRSVVLNDLHESETAHVAEIRGLLENFLEPLATSQILNSDEYTQLMCNFVEIVVLHEELLKSIEDCNDRVGKLFLTKAPAMKIAHQSYCASHPRAIVILDKYKDELQSFMERQGAASPGLLALTTGLSKPFRRLDKYSAMLQELERHMESGHPDRGDTQRGVAIYKEIAASCSAIRRQKELELQVLTGPVRGWQGQELSTLGDIIHMGSVAVGPDHRDRYFVLFPQTLVILSVSHRMSAFIYEGKLPLTGINVNRLDDTDTIKNAFEIYSPLIEKIVAVCQGPNEANKWVDFLTFSNGGAPPGLKRQKSDLKYNATSSAINVPQLPPHTSTPLDPRGYCARFSLCAYSLTSPNFKPTLPPKHYPSTAPYAGLTAHFKRLVKEGLIRRFIVKALLYTEYMRPIDTSHVVLRRRHKSTGRLHRRHSTSSVSDASASFERQNAFDAADSDEIIAADGDGNPFGLVKYCTGKQSSDDDLTEYETFIDYGPEADCTKEIFDDMERNVKHRSSMLIDCDSTGSFVFKKDPKLLSIDYRDSLPLCSKTTKLIDSKVPSAEFKVHTSTAKLNLAAIKQQLSETSECSGFDRRISGGYMACEDLFRIDDSTPIRNPIKKEPKKINTIVDERHSMPTLFVGNRFNHLPSTEVYIPMWKNSNKDDKECIEMKRDDSPSPSTTTHSSSIDLPAFVPAPDQLTAELLYNRDNYFGDVIKPPSMFGPSQSVSLSRDVSPFNRHNLDSDKKLSSSGTANRISSEQNREENRKSARRCLSYQFFQLNTENVNRENPEGVSKKCRCCASSKCPSPRSSDSGMAGSCTIASPDPPKFPNDFDFHYNDCHRRNSLRHSQSSQNFASYRDRHDNTDSGQYGDNFSLKDREENHTKVIQQHNMFELSTGRDNVKQRTRCLSAERSVEFGTDRSRLVLDVRSSGVGCSGGSDGNEVATFKTGLYAHWWKKEKLPNSILRELVAIKSRGEVYGRRGSEVTTGARRKQPANAPNTANTVSAAQTQPLLQSSPQQQTESKFQQAKSNTDAGKVTRPAANAAADASTRQRGRRKDQH